MRVEGDNSMRNELRHALRRLISSPSFTATAVLTLALGIGANTSIFTVVSAVLLRPLPYPEPDRLVALEMVPPVTEGKAATPWPWSYPRFEAVRELTQSFSAVAAFNARPINLTGGGNAERVLHEFVSASYFDVLGARAQRGRLFEAADDDAATPRAVALISDGLWQRRFGGANDIIGSTLLLNDISFTVIGVLPRSFRGMGSGTEVWTPMAMAPALFAIPNRLRAPNAMWHQVMGKLRSEVSVASALAELAAVRAAVEQRYPSPRQTQLQLNVRPLVDATIDPTLRRSIWILFGAVVFVLLITAANLSNLLLTRATSYRKQLAIRRALGASGAALARHTVAEALVLAVTGGVVGMLLAIWGVELLTSLRPERLDGFWSAYARVVDAESVNVTAAVFAFNFGLALLTGLAFAVLPAWQAARVEIVDALRGVVGASGLVRRSQLGTVGRALIVLQMAAATVLATGAGVMLQSFARMMRTDLGARAEQLLTFRVDLPRGRYDEARTRVFQTDLEARLAALPGVASVALANALPVSGQTEGTVAAAAPGEPDTGISLHMISTDYFRTFGIRVIEGRTFTASEYDNAAPVALLNETGARTFFPEGNAVGRRLRHAAGVAPEVEIIGIVNDVRYDAVEQPAESDLYITNAVYPSGSYYIALRGRGEDNGLATSARRALQQVDAALPMFDVRSMEQRLGDAVSRTRFVTSLLGAFAVLALVIAGIGVYGVVSYTVGARAREIGIRMALGARQRRVLREVLLDSALVSGAALLIGVPAALATTRVLSSMLYGVKPHDTATISGVAALVVAVALLATWQPARRAARTDPMTVLRND